MRAREGKLPSSARVGWNAPVWLWALLCVATAQAQPLSPEVSRGLAWLQSQVQVPLTQVFSEPKSGNSRFIGLFPYFTIRKIFN